MTQLGLEIAIRQLNSALVWEEDPHRRQQLISERGRLERRISELENENAASESTD